MSNQRKLYRPIGDSRRDMPRMENADFMDTSGIRVVERHENVNSQLIQNYKQLKQLLKDRVQLLKTKQENLINRNRQKINAILNAREQDLKNEAKSLNDPTLINLFQQTKSLNKSKQLLSKVADIRDIQGFIAMHKSNGKRFWDKHKDYEKEKKFKSQNYANLTKALKDHNYKEREIFLQIESRETQIMNILFRDRKDPEHVKKAEKLNDEIEKKKMLLKELKVQKTKLKNKIKNVIDEFLEFNRINQDIFIKKIKQMDEIAVGSQNLDEFDNILDTLQRILVTTSQQNNQISQGVPFASQKFPQIFRNYDFVFNQVDRLKQEQDSTFEMINRQFKQNAKNVIMQKILLGGVQLKQDQGETWRKCKQYRKLLFEIIEQKQKFDKQINKVNAMNQLLTPFRKNLITQEARRQQLRSVLRKMCVDVSNLEDKTKELKNFKFDIEELHHKLRQIQNQINESAQKINIAQYKNKMKQFENITRRINQKSDKVLQEQIQDLERKIQKDFRNLEGVYFDLIQQVEINEQQTSMGVFLTKLQKRLSLV